MLDVLHTLDGDVDFTGGDLQLAESCRATEQHKRDIILAAPGDFKESPTVGVGAVEYIQDEAPLLLRDIRKQMQLDGMAVDRVELDGTGALIISGGYESD